MAYPIQCSGGFPMPLLAGKMEIVGFSATIETPASAAQIAIFDDQAISSGATFGNLIAIADIYDTKTLLVDFKTVASTDGNISYLFPEAIKTRRGISIAADNIRGGSICLYRR